MERKGRAMRGKGIDELWLTHGLSTWRRSNAEAPREVILQGVEHSRHVPLHLVQIDDVFHQRRVNVHFGRLTLPLGLDRAGGEREQREKQENNKGCIWQGRGRGRDRGSKIERYTYGR